MVKILQQNIYSCKQIKLEMTAAGKNLPLSRVIKFHIRIFFNLCELLFHKH